MTAPLTGQVKTDAVGADGLGVGVGVGAGVAEGVGAGVGVGAMLT